VYEDVSPTARLRTGKTIWRKCFAVSPVMGSYPTGSTHPSFTAKISDKIRARANPGNDTSVNMVEETNRSKRLSSLYAVVRPRGIAMSNATI
jgi:hypothetical protein